MDPSVLFSESDYKALLRTRQKSELRERPNLTWKYIADKIGIQHTYVSRSLRREEVHLNEDHLFEVLDILKFDDREREYLMLLRAKSLSANEKRRAHIQQKIDTMVKEHVVRVDSMKKEASPEETAFLMNPTLLLIYVALHVKRYANSVVLLERVFGLTTKQLSEHLKQLETMDLVKLHHAGKSVREVKENTKHFAKEHPLMRGHQHILRHLCAAKIARTEDQDKVSFMASFSASDEAFGKIKDEFYKFLNEVQKHATTGDGERVYQLGFDLFRWD